jgi:thiosulfate reductase cytochrome b subunit
LNGPLADAATAEVQKASPMERPEVIYRHSGMVRITHWINALVLLVLLMSGLQIFNAHPALYLGQASEFDDPLVAMEAVRTEDGPKGITTVFGWDFDTTGVLGLGGDAVQGYQSGAFRGQPAGHRNLSMGRRWHFFFAWLFLFNGLAYLLWSLGSGHLRRDLAPSGRELKHIGASIWDHARLRFPKGEEAKRYNVLQKLAYLGVALILLPLMLTGLAMSPGIDAAFPLIDMLGAADGSHHPFAPQASWCFVVAHRHGADLMFK